jgi:hypothetical protein
LRAAENGIGAGREGSLLRLRLVAQAGRSVQADRFPFRHGQEDHGEREGNSWDGGLIDEQKLVRDQERLAETLNPFLLRGVFFILGILLIQKVPK